MLTRSLVLLASASLSTAHFLLLNPPTAGFDDDKEPIAPCGGATVVVNSSSPQVHVEKFPISLKSTHPTGLWGIRGTNSTKEPFEFVDLAFTISTTGVGEFCLPEITAPKEWAGKEGVLQIIDYSIDGILYQCAPVNWASGLDDGKERCHNATGFTATFTGNTTQQAASSANNTTVHDDGDDDDDDDDDKSVSGSNSTAGSPASVLTNTTTGGKLTAGNSSSNSTGGKSSSGAGTILTSTGSFLGLSVLAAFLLL